MMTVVQGVRLFDVFVLGPLMLYFAYNARGVGQIPKTVLAVSGLMTVLYNGDRYLQIEAQGEASQTGSNSLRRLGYTRS